MARLTDVQRAVVAKAAGFPVSEIPTAVAVSLAENSGDPAVRSPMNSDGTYDHGWWQINSVHADILASGNWQSPMDNARMAKAVWDEAGQSWSPWTTYKNGSYRLHLGRGQAALAAAKRNPAWKDVTPANIGKNWTNTNPIAQGYEGIAGFFQFVTDPDNWVRVGYIVAGAVLILIALVQMTNVTSFARKALPV